MTRKKNYLKPKVTKKKVKVNFFFTSRAFDSLDMLLGPQVFAQSSGSQSHVGNICFLPGTQILLPSQSTKPVEDIKVGDVILSYDLSQASRTSSRVIETYSHERDSYVSINNIIRVTDDHPLCVNGDSWKEAGKINLGDYLVNHLGQQVLVERVENVYKKSVVYNIRVEGKNKNYFADGILAFSYRFRGDIPIIPINKLLMENTLRQNNIVFSESI